MPPAYRVGVDENGLGARLGPLVVTAVAARVAPGGQSFWMRRPRGRLAADLDDSKRLVSHANVDLGEAWARSLTGERFESPQRLFAALSIEGQASLRADCPRQVERQCWGQEGERFRAPEPLRRRLRGHLERLRARGIEIAGVHVKSVCTQRLNRARATGKNRFVCDLHAMEELLLAMRRKLGEDFSATCGKVGGMNDYDRFFGPLATRPHTSRVVGQARSAYHFPGLGEVSFERNADARDPLVMLASLVGKYVRELLMARVSRFYAESSDSAALVSGYHDPKTSTWVKTIERKRRALRIVDDCFERSRDAAS